MLPKTPPKADDPEQSRRFIEMAQEREAEGSSAALERAIKTLAPHGRLKPKNPKRKKKAGAS